MAALSMLFAAPAVASEPPSLLSAFGSSGSGEGQFGKPADIALDFEEDLWVADIQNDRIEQFSPQGDFLWDFGQAGIESGQLSGPRGLAIDLEGNVWVSDSADRIQSFSPIGEHLDTIGSTGSGNGRFNHPEGVAIDFEGNVWVADSGNGRLQKFSAAGEFLEVVGSKGTEPGQLGEPTGVDVDPWGNVWVADRANDKIVEFDGASEFVREFGESGSGNGHLDSPGAIAADGNGHLWIADEGNDRVQEFNELGEYLDQFGSEGSESGQFYLDSPLGIATNFGGILWVADGGNDRVQRWAVSGYEAPVCHDGSVATDVGEPLFLWSGDLKCDGTELAFEIVSGPSHGSVSEFDPSTGSLVYTPDPDYSGLDFVEFRANNGLGSAAVATIELRVGKIPIAAYSFDEGEGLTAHDVFGENDGALDGAEWIEEGRYGPGVVFDGSSMVTIPDSEELDLTGEFTLEAWIKPHFKTPAPLIFAKTDSNSPYYGYLLYAHLSEELPVAYLAGSELFGQEVEGEAVVPAGQWTHVALTSTGTQTRLYVNGELDSVNGAGPLRSSDGPLGIGGSGAEEASFDGRIDEVRVYAEALSAEEIVHDRDTPVGETPALKGPVAAFPFDEGQGEVAHDIAGSHDGLIDGAEWVAGKFRGALRFSSSAEDSVAIPSIPDLDLANGFSLEAWVKPDVGGEWQPVLSKEAPSSSSYSLYSGGEESHVPTGVISTEEGEVQVHGGGPLAAETWAHLALTSDGADLKLYVNGELVEVVTGGVAEASEGDLRIGGHVALEQYFDGVIDEVRVYDRPLSTEEIVADRDLPLEGPQVSLGGPLVEAGVGQLVSPSSPMNIDIYDGGTPVSEILLLLDDEVERSISIAEVFADGATEDCSGNVCHLTYMLRPGAVGDLSEGEHVVGVRVVNRDGRSTTRKRAVVFDTRPPELELSGELAEADGGSLEALEATLEIASQDGKGETDSGIDEFRLTVDGQIALAESFECEPKCPESETAEFKYDKLEWGEGPHKVEVFAVDGAGNETSEVILVDAQPISVQPSCANAEPSSVEAVAPVTAGEALEALEERLPGAIASNLPPKLSGFSLDPSWFEGEETFAALDAFTAGRLVKAPAGPFTIGSAACLAPAASTPAETVGQRLPGLSTVIHANSAPQTDTAIRLTPLGSAIITSFRGESAPPSLSWRVKLGAGEELQELTNGAVALVKPEGTDINPPSIPTLPPGANDPESLSDMQLQLEASIAELGVANDEVEGQVMAIIAPPVAVDSEGQLLSAELSIEGDLLTVTRPEEAVALVIRASSAPDPVAICAVDAPSHPTQFLAACGEEEKADGDFISNFDRLDDRVIYSLATFEDSGEGNVASSRIYVADGDGNNREAITGPNYLYFDPKVSPDEERVVATRCDLSETNCSVRVMNVDGSEDEEVVADAWTGRDYMPIFGSDSDEIYLFRDTPTGANEEALERQLYYVESDGMNERKVTDVLNTAGCPDAPPCNLGITGDPSAPSVSPDGEEVAFTHLGQVLSLATSAEGATLEEMDLLVAAEGEEAALWPTYSPDGTKILYYYEESPSGSAKDGLFTMKVDGSEKTRVLAYPAGTGEARTPSFLPNEEIGFVHQGSIVAVEEGGSQQRLVSDGDEQVSLVQLAATGDSQDIAAAEGVEDKLDEIQFLYSANTYDAYKGASDGEKAFCINNIYNALECIRFFGDRATALDMRERIFTARNRADRSTRGNAFQHAFWTGLMVHSSVDSCPVTDGLVFALLHEGDPPYSWDSRQDVLNDLVGNKFVCEDNPESEWHICEGLRIKSQRMIFIGAHINPDRWASENHFGYKHLVFRKLASDLGLGPIVELNGRTCEILAK